MQGLQGVGGVQFRHIVALHLQGGAGDEFFLLYAVTDDDDIFERVGFLFEHDVKVRTCDLDVFGDKSDVGDDQRLSLLGIDGEITIKVSNRACLRALHLNGRSDERFSIDSRCDRTGDHLSAQFTRLQHIHCREQQQSHQGNFAENMVLAIVFKRF